VRGIRAIVGDEVQVSVCLTARIETRIAVGAGTNAKVCFDRLFCAANPAQYRFLGPFILRPLLCWMVSAFAVTVKARVVVAATFELYCDNVRGPRVVDTPSLVIDDLA
jgi:hypothetical protein